jgi:hypothetical protein
MIKWRNHLQGARLGWQVTGNTDGLPASHLVHCVCSAPPTAPTCVHTETETMIRYEVCQQAMWTVSVLLSTCFATH